MATLTDYNNNNDEQIRINVIHVSVCFTPEIHIDEHSNRDIQTKEVSTEEKQRLFYQKRLQNITKCLKFLETN